MEVYKLEESEEEDTLLVVVGPQDLKKGLTNHK